MTTPTLVAKFARRYGTPTRQIEIAAARHLEQGRTDEQKKCDHRRDGVARESEDETGLRPAEHERLAGFDRHFPEFHRAAQFFEHGLHEVVLADRNAARRDEHVALETLAQFHTQFFAIIAGDAETH